MSSQKPEVKIFIDTETENYLKYTGRYTEEGFTYSVTDTYDMSGVLSEEGAPVLLMRSYEHAGQPGEARQTTRVVMAYHPDTPKAAPRMISGEDISEDGNTVFRFTHVVNQEPVWEIAMLQDTGETKARKSEDDMDPTLVNSLKEKKKNWLDFIALEAFSPCMEEMKKNFKLALKKYQEVIASGASELSEVYADASAIQPPQIHSN